MNSPQRAAILGSRLRSRGGEPGDRDLIAALDAAGPAVNAGFAMGAEIASLQASPMGESLYRAMGFEAIYDYRLYLCQRPEGER